MKNCHLRQDFFCRNKKIPLLQPNTGIILLRLFVEDGSMLLLLLLERLPIPPETPPRLLECTEKSFNSMFSYYTNLGLLHGKM